MPRGWGWPEAAEPQALPGTETDQPSRQETRLVYEPASWHCHPSRDHGSQLLWLGTGSPSWCSRSYQLQIHHCGRGKGEGQRERERERDRRVKLNHIVLLYCTREVGKRGEFGDYDKWKTEKKSSDKKDSAKVILLIHSQLSQFKSLS